MTDIENEWLWGWDPTPGIVSVWVEKDGQAIVWRRLPKPGVLVREVDPFRPWVLLDRLDYLEHLGSQFGRDGSGALVTYRELAGPGELRFLVQADRLRTIKNAVLH